MFKNRENIERVTKFLQRSTGFQRTTDKSGRDVVAGWGPMRLKAHPGPRIMSRKYSTVGNVVVLIALEQWTETNGVILKNLDIDAGEDICMENKPGTIFPGPGGANLIMITLNL